MNKSISRRFGRVQGQARRQAGAVGPAVLEAMEGRCMMSGDAVGGAYFVAQPTQSALLLPAVQKIREAAGFTDGTSNTIAFG
jgi:hypothetical protein